MHGRSPLKTVELRKIEFLQLTFDNFQTQANFQVRPWRDLEHRRDLLPVEMYIELLFQRFNDNLMFEME